MSTVKIFADNTISIDGTNFGSVEQTPAGTMVRRIKYDPATGQSDVSIIDMPSHRYALANTRESPNPNGLPGREQFDADLLMDKQVQS